MSEIPPFPEPFKPDISLKKLLVRLLAKRWIRFGIVGGAATLVYFMFGLLFVKALGLPLLAGNLIAYLLGFIVSYTGQKKWTFESEAKVGASLPRFALAQLAGLGLNSAIIEILAVLKISYEISMAAATVLVPLFVYFICKFWVFPAARSSN